MGVRTIRPLPEDSWERQLNFIKYGNPDGRKKKPQKAAATKRKPAKNKAPKNRAAKKTAVKNSQRRKKARRG